MRRVGTGRGYRDRAKLSTFDDGGQTEARPGAAEPAARRPVRGRDQLTWSGSAGGPDQLTEPGSAGGLGQLSVIVSAWMVLLLSLGLRLGVTCSKIKSIKAMALHVGGLKGHNCQM